MKQSNVNRAVRAIAISLLMINGLSALAGGVLFMIKPDGGLLHVTTHLLRYSPFGDFLLPGLVLVIFNGFSSLVIGYISWKKPGSFPLLISLQGFLLGGWLVVQVVMLQNFSPQHLAMGLIALVLIFCGSLLKWN